MQVDITNKTRQKVSQNFVKRVVLDFCRMYKVKESELSIVFIGDRLMRRLNKQLRRKDKVTDILTFSGEDDLFGELIIDYQQIKRQAAKFALPVRIELAYILIHGLLHLRGHKDDLEKDAQKMAEIGQSLIKKFFSVKIDLQ